MTDFKTIIYLKKFQEHSIDTFKLLTNDSIQSLFLFNDEFNELITARLKLWIGHYNWLKKILNDEYFYNELEEFYKKPINWIYKTISSNEHYKTIFSDNIIECNDLMDSSYENNLSTIKKEYGHIHGKSLQLSDISNNIYEENKLIIEENNESDLEKDKLRRLSTKEKFKIIKKEYFYKQTIRKFVKLHIIIRNKDYKKKETDRITNFFLHGYNEFFGLDINLATMSSDFKNEFFNKIDNKGFTWAIRVWVGLVSLPLIILCIVLPILLLH